ncbi:hypothetical protein QBC35DRAFT_470151 [Podospora australis]|uniref:Uncharacterized protein n=1 Tax=Podospora australis TaxID=1536484 RepID=A0AAN6X577_9PEZI|nr:hypothetical protein QBC35DRAFT_470151 [Podospora australis]
MQKQESKKRKYDAHQRVTRSMTKEEAADLPWERPGPVFEDEYGLAPDNNMTEFSKPLSFRPKRRRFFDTFEVSSLEVDSPRSKQSSQLGVLVKNLEKRLEIIEDNLHLLEENTEALSQELNKHTERIQQLQSRIDHNKHSADVEFRQVHHLIQENADTIEIGFGKRTF